MHRHPSLPEQFHIKGATNSYQSNILIQAVHAHPNTNRELCMFDSLGTCQRRIWLKYYLTIKLATFWVTRIASSECGILDDAHSKAFFCTVMLKIKILHFKPNILTDFNMSSWCSILTHTKIYLSDYITLQREIILKTDTFSSAML